MFERLLQIGADFNALDAEGRVRASLRYAATPEIPLIAERVLLVDAEGSSCIACVEEVAGPTVMARAEWETWIPGQVARLSRVFTSSSGFVEHDRPPTSSRGEHVDVLEPA